MFKATLLALMLSVVSAMAKPAAVTGAEIPFKFVDGFIIIDARVGERAKPLFLLLDSGASTSVLSIEAAEKLRLPLLEPEPVQGVGTQSFAYHIPPVKAAAGNVHLTKIPIALDLSNAASICRHPVDGLLGMDFFAGKIVQIDYAARRLRILSKSEESPEHALKLPIQLRNGVICVPVGVNGSEPRWTRLDTGSNDALHWVMRKGPVRKRQATNSMGFLTDETEMIKASVQLGNRTLNSVSVAPHGQTIFSGEAGLLGNGILAQFKVTIDTRNRQLVLQDSEPSSIQR